MQLGCTLTTIWKSHFQGRESSCVLGGQHILCRLVVTKLAVMGRNASLLTESAVRAVGCVVILMSVNK